MAGNLVSIMAVSSRGRGGRTPETHTNRSFTLQNRNSKFLCTKCGTVIQDASGECPYCHSHGCLSNIPRRHKYNMGFLLQRTAEILITEGSTTRARLAEVLNIPAHVAAAVCKMLPAPQRSCIRHGNCH